MKNHAVAVLLAALLALAGCRSQADPPTTTFAAIADCQFADVPTSGLRQYRGSVTKLARCVAELNQIELDFAVHLGDFIDRDEASFEVVGPIYRALKTDRHHVLGNHDYSVSDAVKARVPGILGMPARYHSFVRGEFRFVVLDGNDVSFHAHAEGSAGQAAAQNYYEERGITSPKWNGALGEEQLHWLEQTLVDADAAGERVILFCHFPVYPEDVHNLWNAAEVVQLLASHPSVVAYLNGHNHAGGYAEHQGVHFLTMHGMVDTDETAYAVITLDESTMSVAGRGREPDRLLPLR